MTDCEGCIDFVEARCTAGFAPYPLIKADCPCTNCVVKMMCSEFCEDYGYLVQLALDVDEDEELEEWE